MNDWQDTDEAQQRAARRERVLRQALQDTMSRNGLPRGWLAFHVLPAVRRSARTPGFHVQLVVNGGWDVLKTRLPELELAFRDCAGALDAASPDWILSVAWVFDEPQHAAVPPGWVVRTDAAAAQHAGSA